VLASLELARTTRARVVGLIGKKTFEGAMLIEPCRAIHTIGVRFPLDVAYLDKSRTVIAMTRLAPNRIGLPRKGVRAVLEAEAGAFERWRLALGDELDVQA
jgi:uncharacterized protein